MNSRSGFARHTSRISAWTRASIGAAAIALIAPQVAIAGPVLVQSNGGSLTIRVGESSSHRDSTTRRFSNPFGALSNGDRYEDDPYYEYYNDSDWDDYYSNRRIEDSTLINPVIINSDIEDSTLINPVIVDSPYPRRIVVRSSSSFGRTSSDCMVMASMRAACNYGR